MQITGRKPHLNDTATKRAGPDIITMLPPPQVHLQQCPSLLRSIDRGLIRISLFAVLLSLANCEVDPQDLFFRIFSKTSDLVFDFAKAVHPAAFRLQRVEVFHQGRALIGDNELGDLCFPQGVCKVCDGYDLRVLIPLNTQNL